MFHDLITGNLAMSIEDEVSVDKLAEIRLRVGKPALLVTTDGFRRRPKIMGREYVVKREDIDGIILRAANMSPYSVSEEMIKGFITYEGIRIGLAGEGVTDGGKLIGIKNVNSLSIRVPHQILNAADGVIDKIMIGGKVNNTLIISPPSCGKTTVLREIARLLSKTKNVVVIDERYELAAVSGNKTLLDVGECDVLSGIRKADAYESCIRALSPEVIVTDEIFGAYEVGALLDVMRSGVHVIASIHGEGVDSIKDSEYSGLLSRMDLKITLQRNPVGSVKSYD